jgi:hypothetical protein
MLSIKFSEYLKETALGNIQKRYAYWWLPNNRLQWTGCCAAKKPLCFNVGMEICDTCRDCRKRFSQIAYFLELCYMMIL